MTLFVIGIWLFGFAVGIVGRVLWVAMGGV